MKPANGSFSVRNRSVSHAATPLERLQNVSKNNVSNIVSSARLEHKESQNPFIRRTIVKAPSYIKNQIAAITEKTDRIVMSDNAQDILSSATKVQKPDMNDRDKASTMNFSSNAFNSRVIGILKDSKSYRHQSWQTIGGQPNQDTITDLPSPTLKQPLFS